jgi:protein-S-isoprenylcysteine O-methyltransferase Ste14
MLAEVSGGHELTTTGPFAYVRHPLYAALDLLALGTALWVPHPTVIAGALLAAFVGDRRARTEERLLLAVYGDAYARYAARVRRLVPGLY